MGVETNAMQFYPEASRAEAQVHAGLFQRKEGKGFAGQCAGAGFLLSSGGNQTRPPASGGPV